MGLDLPPAVASLFPTPLQFNSLDIHGAIPSNEPVSDTENVSGEATEPIITKSREKEDNANRKICAFRLLPDVRTKLTMLSRETGRSQREIVEMLIKMAKVGQYESGD